MADETPSPDASTRWIETSRGILRYTELAPLLAERVLRVQERIETGGYAEAPLDEDLLRALHRD
jgi:CRISPR-associated endonuclease/helicase Cas3